MSNESFVELTEARVCKVRTRSFIWNLIKVGRILSFYWIKFAVLLLQNGATEAYIWHCVLSIVRCEATM